MRYGGDSSCPDCQRITSGDCGQHVPGGKYGPYVVINLSDAALRERKDIAGVLYDEWDCVHTETMRREYNEDGHEDFANLAPAELAQWLAVADKAIALRDAAKREGAMEEAAKHADCCVAREEQLDAARAEQREALNRAWAKCVVMEAQAAEMIHMYAESENKFGLGHMAGVREHIKELRDLLASTLGR